jgi:transposase
MSRRTKYDPEFKREAVRLAIRGDRSAAQVARDLGLHPNILYVWKAQLKEDPEFSFPGQGNLKPQDQEMRDLRRRLRDVEEERDILKKALAIFSQEKH